MLGAERMDQRNNEAIEIDIKDLFYMLMQKWRIILAVGVLCSLTAGMISIFGITPTYTSTSKLYVINRQNEKITTWADMESGTYLAKDIMILVKSRPVTEEVIRSLKLNMTEEELSSKITINIPVDTRIMNITVTFKDPQMAKKIVDEVARVSSEQLVKIMEINKINIVEKGNIPLTPAGPNVKIFAVLCGALGVFITSFLFIIIQLINDTIRTSEDVEKYLGLTTLGVIPKEESIPVRKKGWKVNWQRRWGDKHAAGLLRKHQKIRLPK
jgi:capsular polysaccharide biosynthesis protein